MTSCIARLTELSSRYSRLVAAEITLTISLALLFYILYTHRLIDTSVGGVMLVFSVGLLILAIPGEWLRRTASKLNVQRRTVAFYESRLRRVRGTWPGTGDPGNDFATFDKPLDRDLDLFGTGSLFEYLCSAKTGGGRRWLATSLLELAPLEQVALRQQAVRELRDKHRMREALAGTVPTDMAGFDGDALRNWLAQPRILIPKWLKVTTIAVAFGNFAVIFLALAGRFTPEIPLASLLLVGIFTSFLYRKVGLGRVIESSDPMVIYELELLQSYRRALQVETFQAELLKKDMKALNSLNDKDMRRLIRRLQLMRWHADPAFTYISYLSLW